MTPAHTDNVPEKLCKGAASFENIWNKYDMPHIAFHRGEAIGFCSGGSRYLRIGRSKLSLCFDQIRPAIATDITIDSEGVGDCNTLCDRDGTGGGLAVDVTRWLYGMLLNRLLSESCRKDRRLLS
jgi:hypothetical protein